MANALSPSSWRRYWPAWLTLAAGLAATVALGRELHRQAVVADERRFQLEARLLAQLLETRMERYEERLARLADHCAQFDELPKAIWYFRRDQMTDVQHNLPSVIYAVYCPKVPAAGFAAHAARGQAAWKDRYVFDTNAAPGRAFALPAWQMFTRPGFPPIQPGTDLARATERWPALPDALARAAGWVSPRPVRLLRSDGVRESGFWFVLPVFPPDQPRVAPWQREGEAEEARQARHREAYAKASKGLLAVLISADRLLSDVFNDPAAAPRLHLRIYTGREPAGESLLNEGIPAPARPRHRVVIPQQWYTRNWCLELTSTPEFEAASPRDRAWFLGATGTGLTLLASAFIGLTIRPRLRQEGLTAEVLQARDALAAAETERIKLGHDLHDGAIQSLYAIQLGLTRSAEQVTARVPEAAAALQHARQGVDAVIAELRQFILGEAPPEPQPCAPGLESVLAAMVLRMQPHTSAAIRLESQAGATVGLSVAQVVELSQIAASALANSLRHAQAGNICIALERVKGEARLTVADDGVGFEVGAVPAGMGLPTMRSRAQKAGGRLAVESRPGAGTRVVASVPADEAAGTTAQSLINPPAENSRMHRQRFGFDSSGGSPL